MKNKIKISIIGAFGYSGLELVRLLSLHSNSEIVYLYDRDPSKSELNKLNHMSGLKCGKLCNDLDLIAKSSDVVFMALPHGSSKEYVSQLIGKVKIIDLGSDFRIKNKDLYAKYYKDDHCGKHINDFVYGFLELNENKIKESKYVSNPGCFAMCIQMTLVPFIENIKNVKILAITGSTGGGKTPLKTNHHSIRSKNIFSYNSNCHRHNSEIYQTFANLSDKNFSFVPTSGPFARGIFLTAFIELRDKEINAKKLLNSGYKEDNFVRIQDKIELVNVVGSNFFDISLIKQDGENLIVQSSIDNLIKGAAGNAIQCMNIMFGISQNSGLSNVVPFYV